LFLVLHSWSFIIYLKYRKSITKGNKMEKNKMIRISQEVHDYLREVAKSERRTLTACAEVLIEEKHKTLKERK
jgi:predicted HicB family RNase H-like nuclease